MYKNNRAADLSPQPCCCPNCNCGHVFALPMMLSSMLKIIYKVVKEYEQKGTTIHLSVSGGRKVMGNMAMVAAQMLFGEEDRLWCLITECWKPGDSN